MQQPQPQQQPPPPKVEAPSEDQIAETREIFSLFDKDCDGFVTVDHLGTMLRALGMNPADAEVELLKKEIDQAKLGKFDQNSFMAVAIKRGKDADTVDDLVEALTILSAEGDKVPTIRTERLQHYMVTKGEQMELADFNEIMADFDFLHEEFISIDDLAKLLLNK